LITKILKSPDKITQNEQYEVFLEKVRDLKDDQLERTAFEYFDFISWAEAKASGKEFGEVVREKATMPQV
jgi:hypothetical protein